MIHIENLTREQVDMLDHIWYNLHSCDDYMDWIATLTEDKRVMAQTLMEMLVLEMRDEDLQEETDFAEANDVLKKIANS